MTASGDALRDAAQKAGGLVTLADIARRADVSHQAVRKWRQRGDWPAPVDTIGAGTQKPLEVFALSDYMAWAGDRYKEQMRAARAREARR